MQVDKDLEYKDLVYHLHSSPSVGEQNNCENLSTNLVLVEKGLTVRIDPAVKLYSNSNYIANDECEGHLYELQIQFEVLHG